MASAAWRRRGRTSLPLERTAEVRELLIDSCTRILSQYPFRSGVEDNSMSTALWSELCSGGFVEMLSSAQDGVSLSDGLAVIACVASNAAPVPLAETLLAHYLLRRAGCNVAEGEPLTVVTALSDHAFRLSNSTGRWRITGRARRTPWARYCRSAVIVAETDQGFLAGTAVLDSSMVSPGVNVAGEPRDEVVFADVPLTDVRPSPLSPDHALALGSLIRSAQMTGAMCRILSLTLDYARTRRQFGRALAQFQAIKHSIARLGESHAAAVAAFDFAASVAEAEPGSVSLPIAKIRVGEAATAAAAIAHQVFGATGYTRDHELQAHTRRIWSWRDEFGSEAQWSHQLGRRVCAAGGHSLWPLVSGFAP